MGKLILTWSLLNSLLFFHPLWFIASCPDGDIRRGSRNYQVQSKGYQPLSILRTISWNISTFTYRTSYFLFLNIDVGWELFYLLYMLFYLWGGAYYMFSVSLISNHFLILTIFPLMNIDRKSILHFTQMLLTSPQSLSQLRVLIEETLIRMAMTIDHII